jgi:hypothetical protein
MMVSLTLAAVTAAVSGSPSPSQTTWSLLPGLPRSTGFAPTWSPHAWPLQALEQAISADPVAEELYRRLMRLQTGLGRLDAVQRTYRLLARRLADLDADPDQETEQLVADLLRRPGA